MPSASVTKTTSASSSKYRGDRIRKVAEEEKKDDDDDDDRDDEKDETNPHLSRLLKKLRPFQREAYDYATKGIVSDRQFHPPDIHDAKNGRKTTARRNEKAPAATIHCAKNDRNTTDAKNTRKKDGAKTARMNGRLLLADEMGLGKSITSLAIMCRYMDEWPLLILCPASLRHIWPNEIEKFLPGLPPSSVYVVQGFDDADFYENRRKRDKIRVVVATYSLLQRRSASARCLQDFRFRCVIADESHNLKQKDSQRTQLALPLLQGAKRLALLSGTPALARPVELWTQVYAIAPDLFGSYSAYTKQYCNARRGRFGWDVTGLSNADELHARMKQIMVRRLKADVLDELPSKQRSLVPVPIANKKKRRECEALMNELKETRRSVADLVGDQASGAHFEARKLLMEAYQASGVAKASAVSEYLVEWLRGTGGAQKVLVFGHHKGVLDCLEVAVAKELKGGGHIRIDGTVSSHERAARVRKFQTCSTVRVAILSMTAAGVGLTLTAASCVMFAELHWTPGVLAQAEDRCHRIGQRNAVNVLYLVCEDSNLSVDMQLWSMLGRKVNNLGRVVDGERNASMGAKKAGEGATGGVSVQDELQSFFSETKVGKETAPKVPVKGTIMSFFAKQQQKHPQPVQKMPKNNDTESAKEPSQPQNPIATGTKRKANLFCKASRGIVRETVEWDCEACTFRNQQVQRPSANLTCEMCGAPKRNLIDITDSDDEAAVPQVTPSGTERPRPSNRQHSSGRKRRAAKPSESRVVKDHSKTILPRKLESSLANPIVLSDVPEDEILSGPRKRHKTHDGPNTDSEFLRTTANRNLKGVKPIVTTEATTTLSFSVSRNSGRIAIHFSDTGESSLTNFEVDQIVTQETADRLMEARLNRSHHAVSSVALEYDESALCKLVDSIDSNKLPKNVKKTELIGEIKTFVNQFMLLREIEKKLLKESGSVYSGVNVRQEVLRLVPATSFSTTERFIGGARERARERVEKGIGDDNDLAILQGKYCAYCGGDLSRVSRLPGISSTYCSRECTDQGRLKRGGMGNQLRAQVFALEGGVCRLCGVDGHALFTRVLALEPAERLNALCNANWKLPKSAKALDRLLQNPREGDFWQADHIRAVAEGGGDCGLENLRTLCVPCHAEETQKLRSRLKLRKPAEPEDKKQTDIRMMFKSAKATRT